MKGGRLRKTIPLIVLTILLASIPSVKADPDLETLWCSSFVDSRLGWTRTGGPPYLGDTDGDYISTKTDAQTEGDFGFADLSSGGTITSVTLYIECYGDDAPADDSFDVWVYDGSSWTNEGNIAPSTLAWGTYETLDLSTKLDTDVKVDNAQVYFMFSKSKGADDVYIRRAYLYVDYTPTPEGTNYEREVTQAVSWAGIAKRVWSLTRDTSQGVSLASGCQRTWSTSRSVSTAIIFTSDSLRAWSLSRVVSQALSLTSDAFAELLTFIKRTVSLSITTSFNANRLWTVIRGVSQNLLAQMSAGGLLTPEDPDNPGNPDGVTPSVFNVVNEFNTAMIMMNVLTVLATGAYLFMGRDFAWGAVATFLWFVTALAMLANDPSNWILSRVYGVFGSIFVVLTIVSVVKRLNPEEDQYFGDWE